METLIIKIIPLALGALISPIMFSVLLLVLSGKNHPKTRASAFLVGAMLSLAFVIVIGFKFGETHLLDVESHKSAVSAVIDILLGVLFIFIGIFGMFKNEKENVPIEEKPQGAKFFQWMIYGFAINLFNDSMLFILAAAKEIGAAGVSLFDKAVAMGICIFFELLPVILPLFTFIFAPEKAKLILNPINSVNKKYGKYVTSAIFILFGGYILFRGIKFY